MKYLDNEPEYEDNDAYSLAHGNDIFINFPMWNDNELTEFIISLSKKHDFNFLRAKESGRRVVKDDADLYWQEEHMAIVCTQLYFLLPIAARIDFLSEFLGRTKKHIRYLLGIGITLSQVAEFDKERQDGIMELYLEYWWDVLEWFSKFYRKPQSNEYSYRDKPFKKLKP